MSTQSLTRSDKTAATLGSLLVITVIGVAFIKEFGGIDNMAAKRIIGMAMGGLLIVAGNLLPKLVLPLGGRRDNPRAAAERLAGLLFVMAGLVQIAAWLFAPQDAPLIASIAGLSAVALAGANYLLKSIRRPARAASGADPHVRENRLLIGKRDVVFHILHALAWVFAMFLADEIWGDAAAKWMVIGFVLSQGMFIAALTTGRVILQGGKS